MRIFLSLFIIVALASPAEARLGETHAQIEARFGKGEFSTVSKDSPWTGLQRLWFKKQGFNNIEILLTDISVFEHYEAKSVFTENQIQSLLAANSEGHVWQEAGSDASVRRWTRDDGAIAQLDNGVNFQFKSKFLIDKEGAWQKVRQEAQTPNVEGF